jgi:hypothetical protein
MQDVPWLSPALPEGCVWMPESDELTKEYQQPLRDGNGRGMRGDEEATEERGREIKKVGTRMGMQGGQAGKEATVWESRNSITGSQIETELKPVTVHRILVLGVQILLLNHCQEVHKLRQCVIPT